MILPLIFALLTTLIAALPTLVPSVDETRDTSSLRARDNWSVTRNDLADGICKSVTIIFARGTVEPGNVGDLAGPPFFNALADMVGDENVAVQGVDYAASVIGYLEGGDPAGAATMAALANQAVSQCPSTRLVLSGYR